MKYETFIAILCVVLIGLLIGTGKIFFGIASIVVLLFEIFLALTSIKEKL